MTALSKTNVARTASCLKTAYALRMVTAVSTTCGIIKGLLLASRQRRLITLIALSTTTVVSTATGLRTA